MDTVNKTKNDISLLLRYHKDEHILNLLKLVDDKLISTERKDIYDSQKNDKTNLFYSEDTKRRNIEQNSFLKQFTYLNENETIKRNEILKVEHDMITQLKNNSFNYYCNCYKPLIFNTNDNKFFVVNAASLKIKRFKIKRFKI